MSLEIKYLPQQFRTVYNPVEVVLYETNNTTRNYTGFAYLIDVKDGSTTVGRLKVPPTTQGFGRFDMSGIMESYLSSDLGLLNGTNIDSVYDNTNSYKDFTLEFGLGLRQLSKRFWPYKGCVAIQNDQIAFKAA